MDVSTYIPLVVGLLSLLLGLAIGKAWERYKLRDGRWIDRRRARESQHYVLGLNFLVSNQLDLAIEELTRAARVDADALEIHMILGNVYRERGQVSRAIQVHQSLLQRPKLTRVEHGYVLLCLGLDYKRGGFVDRALEAFTEVLRLTPDNPYALVYLQKLYEDQHQWSDAHRVRTQLMALGGPDTQPRHHAILSFLEYELGTSALAEGQRDRARRHFETAISLSAETTPAYLQLGDVALASGDPAAALHTWMQLVTHAPERAHLAFERVERLAEQRGDLSEFQDRCHRFIAQHPHDWRIRALLGSHLVRHGHAAQAMPLLLAALEQNPHGFTVHQAVWSALLALDLDRTLVQQYIEAARTAVFFLDPHVCLKCHYRSTELLWQCPHCHEWNSFVEERMAAARQPAAEL